MASVIRYLCCLLVFLPCVAVAQTNGAIPIGETLTATINASSQWLSSSGDFAFGFQQLGNEDLFLLAIWYAKILDKTIVWYAKDVSPVLSGSNISLTAGDGLILRDATGDQVWKSRFTLASVAYAVMNNTGNLMLKSSDSRVLWESFKLPTDTILPTQTMGPGSALSSRRSETNFSTGRFQLLLRLDGNVVLNLINLPSTYADVPYYESGTNETGYQLVFNERGSLFIMNSNNQTTFLSQGDAVGSESDYYYKATLNIDGVFTVDRHLKNSSAGSWNSYLFIPDDICFISPASFSSGVCGYNSLCRQTDHRATCECPVGYSLLDPNDAYGSCNIDYELFSCSEENSLKKSAESLYRIEEVTNIDWPLAAYTVLQPYTEDQCRQSCMQDCFCAVAIILSQEKCWKKRLPLSNGRVDDNVGRKAFIKLRRDNSTFTPEPRRPYPGLKDKDNKDGIVVVGSILLSALGFFNFILLSVVGYISYLFYHKKLQKAPQSDRSMTETNLRFFTFKELFGATNGFKEELGRGAFGIVYKGKLQAGSNANNDDVAVKKLDRQVQDGEKEFKAEMNVISQTQHKNLVRLIGFCDEGQNRLLVYEFLPNGTLANFLFRSTPKPSWNKRMDIVFSIARALLYLHEECRTKIIHCDIKPQNILLDDNFNAQISDFGLAKLLMLDHSYTNTGIRGTKGYVAPEWFRNMPITTKVDVYSFGVLLLEVISCRKCVEMDAILEDRAILTDWAYDCYQDGRLEALVADDFEALNDKVNLERYVMIALWCIQEDPSLRPTMRKVTLMLEDVVEFSVPPCPCPFSIGTSV